MPRVKEKHLFLILMGEISSFFLKHLGLPWWLRLSRICLQCGRSGFDPWVGKIPWGREQLFTSVFWPGKFHGQRSLAGYSPWSHKELDRTGQLSLHFTSNRFKLLHKTLRVLIIVVQFFFRISNSL